MFSLRAGGFVVVVGSVLLACGGSAISLGQNDYALQSNADGSATGNGKTCSWDKLPSQGTSNVGDSFKSPDGCNTCKCTASGVACTQIACATDGGSGSGACTYNGKTYKEGESFPSADGCNTCGCNAGEVACTLMGCATACVYDGKPYNVGDTFPAVDGCNTCSCDANQVSCTKQACPSTCTYNGKTYNVGDSFPSTDGCNTCSCMAGGGVACTEKGCAP